jgi:hypothetical protein
MMEKVEYYKRITRYLRWKVKITVEEEDIKVVSKVYILKEDGKLFIKDNRTVIFSEEEI